MERREAPSETRLEKMEAQLERWSTRIDQLAARTEDAGALTTIGEHLRLDELRICRAIARAKFEEYRTAGEERRQSLRGGVEQAWGDLAAAMKRQQGGNAR